MKPDERDFVNTFSEQMAAGAFVFRAKKGHELIYANRQMVKLFECDDEQDFLDYVDGSFDGLLKVCEADGVLREIDTQLSEARNHFGYVFYHIKTKKGNIRRVVNHWTLVRKGDDDLFYAYLFLHRLDNTGVDLDGTTTLPGRRQFRRYVEHFNVTRDGSGESYAILYLNLVNFKLLNLEKGVKEGDACLRILAEILRKVFSDSFVSRVAGDHFAVFAPCEGIYQKTEEVDRQFCESYGNHFNTSLKFGICRFELGPELDVESVLSRAKVACDFVKYDSKTDIAEYSKELADQVKTKEYVIDKIDEAIEKGWIRVYYQPVVRTLTGWLCGLESLVRWIDPEYGFLRPDQFIGTLEREHCIHKLDCFVVEEVCRTIHDRVQQGLAMVPVSINFSRLDFLMCDMFEVVEAAVEKYDVPRDYLHIEITESMIVSEGELMKNVIDRFRRAGYEVWMDDFGSGYSSMTMLKDYSLDTLKLDMNFLTPFTERSKSVIRSAVTMAKEIGLKTVAEGVETKEQLSFLNEIGCGMIQGYYYGRPEPIDQVFAHLAEKNTPIESRKWRHFYEVAGFHARGTDLPLELVEDDGENFKTLFINKSYVRQMFGNEKELTLDGIDRRIYHTNSPLLKKYREYAGVVERSGKMETFYYTVNGSYYCLRAQAIVECAGHYIIEASLNNITNDTGENEKERLDQKLRDLNLLFEDVLLVNLRENTLRPLLGRFRYIDPGELLENSLQDCIRVFIDEVVYPAERDRCRRYMDMSTLKERMAQSPRGYLEEVLQVKQDDGSYAYTEVYLMTIAGTDGNEYLYCMKSFTEKRSMDLNVKAGPDLFLYSQELLENLLFSTRLRAFFKDREGVYRGVSRAFLDYFGLRSSDEIIGRSGDELLGFTDDTQFKQDEDAVLKKGAHIVDAPAQCIVRGVVHNIAYSKIPLYQDGRIIGLAGMVVDQDEELLRIEGKFSAVKKDTVTELMNSHAFIDAVIDHAERYRKENRDYGLILFANTTQWRILQTYGEEFSDRVLKEIADRLREAAGNDCVLARPRDSVFALLTGRDSGEALNALAAKIRDSVQEINEVAGNRVTIRLKLSARLRSEQNVSDEELYEIALKEVTG